MKMIGAPSDAEKVQQRGAGKFILPKEEKIEINEKRFCKRDITILQLEQPEIIEILDQSKAKENRNRNEEQKATFNSSSPQMNLIPPFIPNAFKNETALESLMINQQAPPSSTPVQTQSPPKSEQEIKIISPDSIEKEAYSYNLPCTINDYIDKALEAYRLWKSNKYHINMWYEFKEFTLLSPCYLQPDRFDSNIKMLFTNQCKDLCIKGKGKLLKFKKYKIEGKIGTGKTYAMLFLVLDLRKDDYFRVLYFNRASSLSSPIEIFESLIYAFPTDKFLGPNNENFVKTKDLWNSWYNVIQKEDLPGMRRLISVLNEYCQKNGKRFVLIVDQIEELSGIGMATAMEYYTYLSKFIEYKITCASNNNEIEVEPISVPYEFDCKWGAVETKEYAKEVKSIALSEEDVTNIEKATSLLPLEIKELFKTYDACQKMEKNIDRYLVDRIKYYLNKHDMFYKSRKQLDQGFLEMNFAKMYAKEPAAHPGVYDKRMIIENMDEFGLKHSAICLAAEKGIEKYYRIMDHSRFILFEEINYNKDRNAGNNFEKTVLTSLLRIMEKPDQKEILCYKTSEKSKEKQCELYITRQCIIICDKRQNFASYFAFSSNHTVFIPTDGNFENIDCSIIDKFTKKLYVFQVTIRMKNHRASDIEFLNSRFYQGFFDFVAGEEWTIVFFWVTTKTEQNEANYKLKRNNFQDELKNYDCANIKFEHGLVEANAPININVFSGAK